MVGWTSAAWLAAAWACVVFSTPTSTGYAQQDEPTVLFHFEPCPTQIGAPPGQSFVETIEASITTSDNPDPEGGLQGWSMSLVGQGVTIEDITTRGTVADPVEEGGLRDGGWELSELGREEIDGCTSFDNCAITAVVLSFVRDVTLPPEGTVTVARITVSSQTPPAIGQSVPASIYYADGCRGTG